MNKGILKILLPLILAISASILILGYALFKHELNVLQTICSVLSVFSLSFMIYELLKLNRRLNNFVNKFTHCENVFLDVPTNSILSGLARVFNTYLEKQRSRVSENQEEIKAMEVQMQLSEKQARNTREIIQSIHDAVIVTDSFNRVLVSNVQAADILGFDSDTAQFKQINSVVKNAKVVNLIENALTSKARHRKLEMELEVNGEIRYFDCVISGITNNDEMVGVVAVFHDISKEKEISQMKNEFVSHVSHELKTPLASITAYAEMLADGEITDDETRDHFLSVIQSQAQRLNRLIEDILNVSRIESGLVKVNKEQASVAILIKDAVEMIKSYAAEKDITVAEPANIVYDQVYVDRDMISQVIINLLSNAVKYTKQGGRITVGLNVNDIEGNITVTVTDTGVRIPEVDIANVFCKFYRVSANNKVAKGTGLGLNLVKQIVEKIHGGRVFVESIQGEGSTFGFDLSLCNAQTELAVN